MAGAGGLVGGQAAPWAVGGAASESLLSCCRGQDYGYRSGWAVGSLVMAEKVLQAELGVPKPKWLEQAWYDDNVMGIKEGLAEGGGPASGRNSDFAYAFDEL